MSDEQSFTADIAASALNEHGFLFQQRIHLAVKEDKQWTYEVSEFPVTSPAQDETRIDHILSHSQEKGVWLSLECKRFNPDFKHWIFFNDEKPGRHINAEHFFWETVTYRYKQGTEPKEIHHRIFQTPAQMKVYYSYLEVALNKKNNKWSSTEGVENAFNQVIRGTTGLVQKLLSQFDYPSPSRVIPVVITTASIYTAEFKVEDVDLKLGIIDRDKLTLTPKKFVAVNYPASNSLALYKYSAEAATYATNKYLAYDLSNHMLRTIYVVQAEAIVEFLDWASDRLIERPSA